MTDINGFNINTTFTDGLSTTSLKDLNDTVEIQLTENTIDLIGTNVLVNGAPIGGDGATTTLNSTGGESLVSDGVGPDLLIKGLTAGNDIIINDSVVSLSVSYDDTRLVVVEEKTQNVTATLNNTVITGNVDMLDYTDLDVPVTASNVFNPLNTATDDSYGMRFIISTDINIIRVGVPFAHWTNPFSTLDVICKFWSDADAVTPVGTFIIDRLTPYNNFYILELISPLLLVAGTYRMSFGYKPGMFRNLIQDIPMIFPPIFSNVQGASTGLPDGAYPTTLVVAVGQELMIGGYFWYSIVEKAKLTVDTIIINTMQSTNTNILYNNTIDMNGFNIINAQNINNIRPSGGVFSQSCLTPIVSLQTDLNLIGVAGSTQFGTVTIPPNGFIAGDTFALKVGGAITCANGDTFILVLQTTTSIFATFNITIDGALTNGFWELEVEFMIRSTGTTGNASVVSNGNFTYINSVMFSKGVGVNSVENVTFDTTVSNTLQILYTTGEVSITNFTPTQISMTKLF